MFLFFLLHPTCGFFSNLCSFAMNHSSLTVAILIVSDTASAYPSTDKCVPELHRVFHEAGSTWRIVHTQIVPDDPKAIQLFIKRWTDDNDFVNCIITSGGTGFSIKDQTPEVC
jgi:gephyrin